MDFGDIYLVGIPGSGGHEQRVRLLLNRTR